MAIRTRASGFRASGNWQYDTFTQSVSSVAPGGLKTLVDAGNKRYCLGGFRISGVFTGTTSSISAGVVSLYSWTSNSNYALVAPLWVAEAGAYEGLSYLESQDFGDGLLLPQGADLRVGTDVPFTGGSLKISGVVWGKLE